MPIPGNTAPTASRRILVVHAHPDDEVINSGILMAKYAAEGAHVTLVTCTLGEEGEILVPGLAHLAADQEDALGTHRIGELAEAMKSLGVTDNRFLGGPGRYRDSGMMGVEQNERPTCFWQADLDEASAHLVEVVREVRPQVLVTYDENGGYGHPDHIQAHRVSMRAAELAADPAFRPDLGAAWTIAKIYWYAMPFSFLQAGIDAMRAAGDTEFFNGVERVEDLGMGVPDELITTRLDAEEYIEAKIGAMRAHATQIAVDGPFFALSNNLGQKIWGVECFRLVGGTVAPVPGEVESDLFDRL
ncbi:MAG TPA: N-acetyl-1-D-myo-inositol-2-amino-2-deoxy-alpha-D-glucopyranoside deacetylase [Sporichthya sp.]|nr:N-acetyl-1-D-myo-inositol-2-amino-2-deoxy-alpha-D-glucopyranoside deacetylase [Sporichthya sp.]